MSDILNQPVIIRQMGKCPEVIIPEPRVVNIGYLCCISVVAQSIVGIGRNAINVIPIPAYNVANAVNPVIRHPDREDIPILHSDNQAFLCIKRQHTDESPVSRLDYNAVDLLDLFFRQLRAILAFQPINFL